MLGIAQGRLWQLHVLPTRLCCPTRQSLCLFFLFFALVFLGVIVISLEHIIGEARGEEVSELLEAVPEFLNFLYHSKVRDGIRRR